MIQTVEAVVDADGRVRLLGDVRVSGPRRALVTVLEEPAAVLSLSSGQRLWRYFGRTLAVAGIAIASSRHCRSGTPSTNGRGC